MPIKKASLTIPAGLEQVKDLKYFYSIGPNLVGKDFNSVDVTSSISFVPQGSLLSLLDHSTARRNYLEVQGSSWINSSPQALLTSVSTSADVKFADTSLDYYYMTGYGSEQRYFESTKGITAGSTFYVDKFLDIYSIKSSGEVTKFTPNTYNLSQAINVSSVLPGSTVYDTTIASIIYETDDLFYVLTTINHGIWGYSNSVAYTSDQGLWKLYTVNKTTFAMAVQLGTSTTIIQSQFATHPAKILENDTAIVYGLVARGRSTALAATVLPIYGFLVINKTTGVCSLTNSTKAVSNETVRGTYNAAGMTKCVLDNTLNMYRSYFTYEDQTNGALSIRMQKISKDVSGSTSALGINQVVGTGIIDCTMIGLPTKLLTGIITMSGVAVQSPLLNYGLTQFTDAGVEYLVLHVYPNTAMATGDGPQRHVVFRVDPTDATKLTYVTHNEYSGIFYQGVLPSADGKSFLLCNDSSFLLLNWNSGSKRLIPSKLISTNSVIRRAAYDTKNQIWISTNTDNYNTLQDSLDIYYPTGTKYVTLTPVDGTTLEYLGTTIQASFKVSVFDLTGARLAQSVTLEVVGATFVGGASSLTVQTSASDDVTVRINITGPGAIQVVAVDF